MMTFYWHISNKYSIEAIIFVVAPMFLDGNFIGGSLIRIDYRGAHETSPISNENILYEFRFSIQFRFNCAGIQIIQLMETLQLFFLNFCVNKYDFIMTRNVGIVFLSINRFFHFLIGK